MTIYRPQVICRDQIEQRFTLDKGPYLPFTSLSSLNTSQLISVQSFNREFVQGKTTRKRVSYHKKTSNQ